MIYLLKQPITGNPKNIIVTLGNHSVIFLNKGKVCVVDTQSVGLVSCYKWWIKSSKSVHYAITSSQVSNCKKEVFMHRLLLNVHENMEVDHKNLNGLDNRLSNLRVCTRCQNMWNTSLRVDNSTGVRGVNVHRDGRYRVRIQVNGVRKSLGVFDTLDEAVVVRDKAEEIYYGEYRRPIRD